MRKKYLSALLFGALLFASAGTFTSCKDYDDDIAGLQEQINTVVADLNDLKALVGDGGVSSVTFDEATGVLTVVDAAGTHTYTIKTPADEVGEIKVTIDDERNLVVNDEVIGKVGDVVTVNEEGYLCVNGEATEIKAGKYAILENESDNTYTISLPDAEGNMHTITLLKSVATNIRIDFLSNVFNNKGERVGEYAIFSEVNATGANDDEFQKGTAPLGQGIAWGVASSDIDWKGPKGAVKAGQLLVGQQNEVLVNVYPANVELDKQTLKLVDVNGNAAPVIIKASVADNAGGTTGSRAASNNGNWVLNITMDNTINGSNMGTAFATKEGYTDDTQNWDAWANKRYALQVNGSIMTGYNYVIDTDVAACAMSGADELWDAETEKRCGKIYVGNAELISTSDGSLAEDGSKKTYPLGTNLNLKYVQSSVYDYIFEIVDADKNDAEACGIKLENNVLYAENTAKAAGKTIHLNVILLGVNGEEANFGYTSATETPIAVTFGTVSSDVVTLPVSEYKVTPNQYDWSVAAANKEEFATITLDMGDFFSGLTAEEAVAAAEGGVILKTTDETFPFLRQTIVNEWGTNTENSTIKFYKADDNEVTYNDLKANIRNIKYAKVFYNKNVNNLGTSIWNYKATLGQHILNLTLKDEKGNEIKKANVPVNVTVPSFFELFTKSAAWGDKTAVAVVKEDGTVDLTQLYNNKSEADVNKFFDFDSSFKANGKTAGTLQTESGKVKANIVELNAEAADGNSLRDLSSKLIYKIVPEVTSGAFWVNSGDFTMDLITKLDGAKFVYYVDGKETDIVVEPESENVIEGFNGEKGDKRQGLSFYKAGKDNLFSSSSTVNGLKLDLGGATNRNLICKFDDNAGDKATAVFNNGNLILKGLAEPNTADGYTTVLTITYKKAAEINGGEENGGVDIYETFKINLTVKK